MPFLLPASTDSRPDIPLTGSKISQYAQKHSSLRESSSPRGDVYLSLITQSIRPAWVRSTYLTTVSKKQRKSTNKSIQLYALYIAPIHTTLLSRLYLPASPLLSTPLLHTLRAAATSEILKTTRRPLLQPEQLYEDAKTAFQTLDTLLGGGEWFFGLRSPGLFDVEVFAYTYLILDPAMGWEDDVLEGCLASCSNLVAHRSRLYERCWG